MESSSSSPTSNSSTGLGFFDLPAELRDAIYDHAFLRTTRLPNKRPSPTVHEVRPVPQLFLVSKRFAAEYSTRIPTFSRLVLHNRSSSLRDLVLPARAKLASTLDARQEFKDVGPWIRDLFVPDSPYTGFRQFCLEVHEDWATSLPRLRNIEIRMFITCESRRTYDSGDFAATPDCGWEQVRDVIVADERVTVIEVLRLREGEVLFCWLRGKGVVKMRECCPLEVIQSSDYP